MTIGYTGKCWRSYCGDGINGLSRIGPKPPTRKQRFNAKRRTILEWKRLCR